MQPCIKMCTLVLNHQQQHLTCLVGKMHYKDLEIYLNVIDVFLELELLASSFEVVLLSIHIIQVCNIFPAKATSLFTSWFFSWITFLALFWSYQGKLINLSRTFFASSVMVFSSFVLLICLVGACMEFWCRFGMSGLWHRRVHHPFTIAMDVLTGLASSFCSLCY